MKLGPLCCAVLIAGCAERIAPTVEENTNLVKVVEDPPVVFPDPPMQVVPPALVPVDKEVLPPIPRVSPVFIPTLAIEPAGMSQVSQLREVRVTVEVQGFDPSELAVEFTGPEGNVFERQTRQLTQKRHVRQVAQFALQVSGTVISANNLVGTWTAHIFHNDLELSTLTFEVTP